MRVNWGTASLFALSVGLAAPAAAATAQDATGQAATAQEATGQAPVAAPDEEDRSPGEIVVTAQKREQRLQDVPVAITVLSGDAIANQGGINIESAQYLVPSLNFRKSGTTLNQFLFLRGIGTANFSIAAEPSVSAVLDGVVLSTAGEAFADLVDIERIEVLRGPQGTLFGKNASAGVINIVSKRPARDFGGYVEAGFFFGNGEEYRVRGAVNIPFSPTVRSRFTAFATEYDGNIRNVTFGRRVNGFEHYGIRGVIEAEAGEALTLTLTGDFRKSDDDCCAELIGTLPNNITASVLPRRAATAPGGSRRT
jgi:iron complex outermembrane receptor protein